MGKTTLPLLFCLAFLALIQEELRGHHPSQRGGPRKAERHETARPVADFTLIDQEGKPFRFQNLRGKIVLVGFIYTTCPDVCPLITASMNLVRNHLTDREQKSLFFLSLTTDPDVDRPEVLGDYARRYGLDLSRWALLTGSLNQLEPVWAEFGVAVERKAKGLVNHTPLTGLVDGTGTMRFVYTGYPPDYREILHDFRSLLR